MVKFVVAIKAPDAVLAEMRPVASIWAQSGTMNGALNEPLPEAPKCVTTTLL